MSAVPAGLGHLAFIDTFGVLRSTVVSDNATPRGNIKESLSICCLPTPKCKCFPSRQSSFPDRKSLRGLSPHHRWLFNTSAATTNEPRVAAACLDVDGFTQMFMSHSPAVLGWEVHFLARFSHLFYISSSLPQMLVLNQFGSVDLGCSISL